MEALCIKMEKISRCWISAASIRKKTVVSLQKLRSVLRTQTHTRFCSRFRICVTNMYSATDAISVMLGSVMSVLCGQKIFFIVSTPTHTSAVNCLKTKIWNLDWKHYSLLWSLDRNANCFSEVSRVSPRSLPDPLSCSFADLLLCFCVAQSLSLLSLAFPRSLHHPLCLHSYSRTHRVCLSFKHDPSCGYVQAGTTLGAFPICCRILQFTAILSAFDWAKPNL